MKVISKLVMAVAVAACFTISAQASVKGLPIDTGKMDKKMSKMGHKMDKKMDKMKKGKMSKDTTKM